MTGRLDVTRDEAQAHVARVDHFLALGYPVETKHGDRTARSAVRMAADTLGLNRVSFAYRIGKPDAPGAYFRVFELAPDWSIPATRGELGTRPVLPGYEIASTSTQRDAEGNVEREWVRTRKAAPAQPFQAPVGHQIKGVSALVDADVRVRAQWVKTREGQADPLAFAQALREVLLDVRGAAPLDAPPVDGDDDLLTVFVIPDLHLGMLAHGAECGEDYDLKIASAMVRREIARLLAMAPPSRHAVALFLGDFFHQNDQRNATPRSGHVLDVDSRWRKTYSIGARVAVGVVNAIAERHADVEVAFLPGNHDEDAAVTLAVALELYFEGHQYITVAPGAGIHWFRRFGKCLLGGSHGHTLSPDRMAMMLATDRARDWGETEFRHFFFGHIHHATAKEVGPVRVESFTSPAAKDAYAAAGGYRSSRALNAVTFHATRGEICRHRVNIAAGSEAT